MVSTTTAPVTATVARIVAVLVAAQLAPRMEARPYRGALRMYFTGPRPGSTFGTVRIGARTGRVLRATIHHGNDGPVERFDDGRVFLRALRLIPGAIVDYRGSLTEHHGRYIVDQPADPTGRIAVVDLDGVHRLQVSGPTSLRPVGTFAAHGER